MVPLCSRVWVFLCVGTLFFENAMALWKETEEFLSLDYANAEMSSILASAVELVLGEEYREFLESRIHVIEGRLENILPAMPTNNFGNVGPSAARYVMHRYFIQNHGWHVNGFDPQGDQWNSSSPIDALRELVPQHVLVLFQGKLDAQGFGIAELAVLAATMEALVRHESKQLLRSAYDALQLDRDSMLPIQVADEVIDAHMTTFILGANFSRNSSKLISPDAVRLRIKTVIQTYPTWPETQAWLREVRKTTTNKAELAFADVNGVIDVIGDQYGMFQDRECRSLKHELEALESPRSRGCTRLGDFYGSGKWEFNENPDYLRFLGVLDESNPSDPHVLTANYILSVSNCVASSTFYTVCCRDHCGELLDRIAQRVRAPTASAQQIVDALQPEDVPSSLLQQRLREVARRAGGAVPLYGRLFAQWLHQLHPRECPFPHLAGTTRPVSIDDFGAKWNHAATNTETERAKLVAHYKASPKNETVSGMRLSCVPWQSTEEMIPVEKETDDAHFALEIILMFVAPVAVLCVLWRMFQQVRFAIGNRAKSARHLQGNMV